MAEPTSTQDYPHDAASLYAFRVLERYIEEKDEPLIILAQAQADDTGGLKAGRSVPIHSENTKVAIVGAGIGGLYAGLILQSEEISFDIFEMDNRVGGRLKTHYFSDKKNDYYVCEALYCMQICGPFQTNVNLECRSYAFSQHPSFQTCIRPLRGA